MQKISIQDSDNFISSSNDNQNKGINLNQLNNNFITPGNEKSKINIEEILKSHNLFDKINKESNRLDPILIPCFPEAELHLKRLNDV